MPQIYLPTPIGIAQITERDGYICSIKVLDEQPVDSQEQSTPLLKQAAQQLQAYFDGQRREFDFAMQQSGTPFQQQVWQQLGQITYGTTVSYAKLSQTMGNPLGIRAIAAANGKNNLWIAIPCHRVIGSNGSLTGYAGGLWRKQWLLNHEAKMAGTGQASLNF